MRPFLTVMQEVSLANYAMRLAMIGLVCLWTLGCSSYTGPGLGVPGSDPLVLCEGCGGYSTYNGVCNHCQQIVMEERQFFGHQPTVWNAWPEDWRRAEPLAAEATGVETEDFSPLVSSTPIGKGLQEDRPAMLQEHLAPLGVLPAAFTQDMSAGFGPKIQNAPAQVEITSASPVMEDASPRLVEPRESSLTVLGEIPRVTLENLEGEPRLRQPAVLRPAEPTAAPQQGQLGELTSQLQKLASPKRSR